MQGFLSLLPVLSTLIMGQTVRSACSIFHGTCTKRKHNQWPLDVQIYNRKHKMSPIKRNFFPENGWPECKSRDERLKKKGSQAEPDDKNLFFRRWRRDRRGERQHCASNGLQMLFSGPPGPSDGQGCTEGHLWESRPVTLFKFPLLLLPCRRMPLFPSKNKCQF
jgi:hypothetical protein